MSTTFFTNDFTIFTFISEDTLLSKITNPISVSLIYHKCLEKLLVVALAITLFFFCIYQVDFKDLNHCKTNSPQVYQYLI